MYNIPNKTNFVDDLNDYEFNPFKNESINLVTTSGQAINNADDYQLSKAAAEYAAKSTYYNDTGTANTYVLTPLADFESPTSYTEGMLVRFQVSNTNTGASTVNVNSIGVVAIKLPTGEDLSADDLEEDDYVTLVHNGTHFVLIGSVGNDIKSGGSSNSNLLINSDFEVWQRVNPTAATAITSGYYCDRFISERGTGGSPAATVTRKLLTPGTVLEKNGGSPRYCFNHAQTAVATTGKPNLQQRIEDVYTASGQEVTITFWARLNSGTLTISPNFNQNFGAGGSATVGIPGTEIILTPSPIFKKYIQRFSIPSITGKTVGTNSFLSVLLSFSLNNTFNVDIARFYVNIGDKSIMYTPKNLQQTLQDCFRYCESTYNFDDYPGKITMPGYYGACHYGNPNFANLFFKVKKMKTPTVTFYNPTTGAAGEWEDTGSIGRPITTSTINEGNVVFGHETPSDPLRGHLLAESEL